MNEDQVRIIIWQELAKFILSDKFLFEKHIQILDGRNFQLATSTGTQIGTAAGQKIGFYGVTPVIQSLAISSPTADVNSLKTAVDDIRNAIKNMGITA